MAPPLAFLTSDARILHRMRQGDERALVELYSANRKMVLSYVTKNNGTRDDAEDMLQEALIVLWERVRSGRFEYTAKLSTFIFATVRNKWLRRLARSRREKPSEFLPEPDPDEHISQLDSIIEAEDAEWIASALEKLGEPCKSILMLFYWEEQPLERIAEQLGFANADTVKSKKYQCKMALRRLLQQSGYRHG